MNKQENLNQYIPPENKPRKAYYTLKDVEVHNHANDCWVIIFNKVYDVTKLIQENILSNQTRPIIQAAGTDISHWFDEETKNPKLQVDVNTGIYKYYFPQGQYLHTADFAPNLQTTQNDQSQPWWRNEEYFIGKLTEKSRKIKLINMLTNHEDILEVPKEEKINEILVRYKEFNDHAQSYTWKRLGEPLDMNKTLEENKIVDETDEFEKLDIPESLWYIPAIHLYFNDDLTIA